MPFWFEIMHAWRTGFVGGAEEAGAFCVILPASEQGGAGTTMSQWHNTKHHNRQHSHATTAHQKNITPNLIQKHSRYHTTSRRYISYNNSINKLSQKYIGHYSHKLKGIRNIIRGLLVVCNLKMITISVKYIDNRRNQNFLVSQTMASHYIGGKRSLFVPSYNTSARTKPHWLPAPYPSCNVDSRPHETHGSWVNETYSYGAVDDPRVVKHTAAHHHYQRLKTVLGEC